MNQTLFVLVIPPFGATLIGIVDTDNFRQWTSKQAMLTLHNPKRLVMVQATAQPGDPNTQTNSLQLVPPYFGDTAQETLYVDHASVEVIGEIEDVGDGQDRCTSNNRMYQSYNKMCKDWKMNRLNLISPSAQDVVNINNIAKFPKRR
jgi:hypothetical protein